MLTTKFTLNEADYLVDCLFYDAQSKSVRQKRRLGMFAFVLIFLALSVYSFILSEYYVAACCFAMALFYFFLFPIRLRNNAIKAYKKSIIERYSSNFGKMQVIGFDDEFIYNITTEQEIKSPLSSLETLYEIEHYYFLKKKNGNSYLFPKTKIENIDALKEEMMKLVDKHQLNYVLDLKWKYKAL